MGDFSAFGSAVKVQKKPVFRRKLDELDVRLGVLWVPKIDEKMILKHTTKTGKLFDVRQRVQRIDGTLPL